MGNRVDVARTPRSRCATCSKVIVKGTARVVDDSKPPRFFHVSCAAGSHPELTAEALANVEEGAVFEREDVEAKIAPAVQQAARRKHVERALHAIDNPEHDDVARELLEQLEDDPDNAA